ncbi:AMP-binding protein [Magnetospira sp. QH-2]|uniref:AMP-binding protein n=1 Tax=Magnetospira sp. (strain QH-2) TaxID=1288970 RepID=UPI0003E8122F|nr:AMP-binding protein [Magnetospira sp. QH-2]CCQ73611.1 putative o-succinylbenzoate--CoA ligase [Magnetospira sp. QH-2]
MHSIYPPLPRHIAIHASSVPDRPALVDGDDVLSYAALDRRVRQGVAFLSARNIGPGARVMVVAQNKIDLMIAVLAGMGTGAAVLPVSAAEEDLGAAESYFRPHAILLDRNSFRAEAFASAKHRFDVSAFDSQAPGTLPDLDPESIGLLILTSGTTQGVRRGAQLSHRSLCRTAAYMNQRMGLDDTVRDLVSAPLEHGFGLGRVRCALHLGGTAVLRSGLFSSAAVAEDLVDKQCTMLSAAVSAMTILIEGYLPALRQSAANLKWIELGSGHLPHHHRETLLETFPTTRCFISYGLTEAIRCTILELNAERDKIDTVGRPSPGIALRLTDSAGQPIDGGEEGQIQVSGPNMASGYFDQPEAWTTKRDGDWLITGDIGTLDPEGYLTYVGRTDDMINVGGLKVAPQEVEEALADLMQPRAYAVAAMADPAEIEGFVPALFIETNGADLDLNLEVVRDHLRDRLPNFKIPRQLVAVDELPRTTGTAKIRRAALAETARAMQETALYTVETLITDLMEIRPRWPAVEGGMNLSRRRLAAKLIKQAPTGSPALDLLMRERTTGDNALAREAVQWRELFPLEPERTLAIVDDSETAPLTASLILHTLKHQSRVLFLDRGRCSVAADLGALYRTRARHILLDSNRAVRWAEADRHLSDGRPHEGFQRLAIVSPSPPPEITARFFEALGLPPFLLTKLGGQWRLSPLPTSDPSTVGEGPSVWERLRGIAASVFNVEPDQLSRRSTPGNTTGWDSLAFVTLLTETEIQFGLSLSHREIMIIECLGDLQRLLEDRLSRPSDGED